MIRPGIIAIPRNENPYQELLYQQLRARGHRVRYGGELTPSRTLNLLLLPLELAGLAAGGYRLLHIHWTFAFALAGAERSVTLRRASRLWFALVLWSARRLGMRIVWTAHNVLPHQPVFDDDHRARRRLIAGADLVIAHSPAALEAIRSEFGEPRATEIIPHGPIAPAQVTNLPPPNPTKQRRILFLGRIEPYKGVEELLVVARDLDVDLHLRVAGRCPDPALRARLHEAARLVEDRVTLCLAYVPDDQLSLLLAAADALVYPFRTVTTSGSVALGMAAGRAIIVPELPAFAHLPDNAVIRYPPGAAGLRTALARVAAMPPDALAASGRAARVAIMSTSWDRIADQTSAAFCGLLERKGNRPK